MVQVGVEVNLAPKLKWDLCFRQYFNRVDFKFDIAVLHLTIYILLRSLVHRALYRDDVLRAHFFSCFNSPAFREHNTLYCARAVAEVEEHHLPLVTAHGYPALHKHKLANTS